MKFLYVLVYQGCSSPQATGQIWTLVPYHSMYNAPRWVCGEVHRPWPCILVLACRAPIPASRAKWRCCRAPNWVKQEQCNLDMDVENQSGPWPGSQDPRVEHHVPKKLLTESTSQTEDWELPSLYNIKDIRESQWQTGSFQKSHYRPCWCTQNQETPEPLDLTNNLCCMYIQHSKIRRWKPGWETVPGWSLTTQPLQSCRCHKNLNDALING